MAAVQVAQDGMTLDLLVWRAFGRQDQGLVEQTLALNPGIAAVGSILPIGTRVVLPPSQAAQTAKRNSVRLWG